jgi:hypothetical protein
MCYRMLWTEGVDSETKHDSSPLPAVRGHGSPKAQVNIDRVKQTRPQFLNYPLEVDHYSPARIPPLRDDVPYALT